MRKTQITIYDYTGETDPKRLSDALDYMLRKFKKGKKHEKIQSQPK